MKLLTLIKEDKVFSAFYISGTAIAIASAMVVAFICHILLSEIEPEGNRSKMMYIDNCSFRSEEQVNNGSYTTAQFYTYGVSHKFLDECIKNISGIEAATLYRKDRAVRVGSTFEEAMGSTYKKQEAYTLIFAQADFFKIYNFDFVSGRALRDTAVTTERSDNLDCDITTGEAVITEQLACSLYGSADEAIGKKLYSNHGGDMTVVGVVKNTSSLLYTSNADIYASTFCLIDYRRGNQQVMDMDGNYDTALFLMNGTDEKRFREEFKCMMGKYEEQISNLNSLHIKFGGSCRSHFGHALNFNPDVEDDNNLAIFSTIIIIIMILLLLLPAINLTGFVNNRMKEQQPELGIRKTYGASKLSLLGYVFKQNLLMTVCGGVLGYPLAMAFVTAMSNSKVSVVLITRMGGESFNGLVDMSMFFSPWLFIAAFGCCFVITTLAALIPAIRALRHPIVESLNLQR